MGSASSQHGAGSLQCAEALVTALQACVRAGGDKRELGIERWERASHPAMCLDCRRFRKRDRGVRAVWKRPARSVVNRFGGA